MDGILHNYVSYCIGRGGYNCATECQSYSGTPPLTWRCHDQWLGIFFRGRRPAGGTAGRQAAGPAQGPGAGPHCPGRRRYRPYGSTVQRQPGSLHTALQTLHGTEKADAVGMKERPIWARRRARSYRVLPPYRRRRAVRGNTRNDSSSARSGRRRAHVPGTVAVRRLTVPAVAECLRFGQEPLLPLHLSPVAQVGGALLARRSRRQFQQVQCRTTSATCKAAIW